MQRHLSPARLTTYLTEAGGDFDHALLLYRWNSAVAAAFWESLGYGEIALRNALHEALAKRHTRLRRPDQWYDDPRHELNPRGRDEIALARNRLTRAGAVLTPGKIVAELPFGFWRYLLARRYTATLWPVMRTAFPHLPGRDRRLLEEPVTGLHHLRNRIAHHEPLLREDLAARYADLVGVLDAIDPVLRAWALSDGRVPALLAQRP